MFNLGLVSVSFRKLSPEQIISLCCANQLTHIEWGGDVHVPAGDLTCAARVAELTRRAGLTVSAYGSYYRIGTYGDGWQAEFAAVLATAKALGAPRIRVWAHNRGSAEIGTGTDDYRAIVDETRAICNMAAADGIMVTFECHNRTLTDDYASSMRYLRDVACANACFYWQPNQFRDTAYNLAALAAMRERTVTLHVFNWREKEKLPLAEGKAVWQSYLALLDGDGRDRDLLLEFMPDGSPDTLPCEAAALRELAWEE